MFSFANLTRNWKTSTIACVTAFLAFVAFDPQWFPAVIVSISKFAAMGGLASLGLASKDSSSHSTIAEVQTATIEAEAAAVKVEEAKKP